MGEPGHWVKIILLFSSLITEEMYSGASKQIATGVSLARTGHVALLAARWAGKPDILQRTGLNGFNQSWFLLRSFHVASLTHNRDLLLTASAIGWEVGFGLTHTVSSWMWKMAGGSLVASALWKPLLVPAEPAVLCSYIPKKMIMQNSESFLVSPNILEKEGCVNNLFSWYGPFGCKTIFQS